MATRARAHGPDFHLPIPKTAKSGGNQRVFRGKMHLPIPAPEAVGTVLTAPHQSHTTVKNKKGQNIAQRERIRALFEVPQPNQILQQELATMIDVKTRTPSRIHSGGWIDPDEPGTWGGGERRRRAGGTAACVSPAAEIIAAPHPAGLIGKTWLLDPPRIAPFPDGMTFEAAIERLEAAELEGHGSRLWEPLTPPSAPFHSEEIGSLLLQYGYALGGVTVAIDHTILSSGGSILVFPDLASARLFAWAKAIEIHATSRPGAP